jgi:hypothetical protein
MMSKLDKIRERHEFVTNNAPSFSIVNSAAHKDRGELLNIEIPALQAKLDGANQDIGFYKCCALSGEVPKEGSQPSALDDDE